jgi:hypothetical protein
MGHAVYPIALYFNHDCDPTLLRHTGIKNHQDFVLNENALVVDKTCNGESNQQKHLYEDLSVNKGDTEPPEKKFETLCIHKGDNLIQKPDEKQEYTNHHLHKVIRIALESDPIISFMAARDVSPNEPLILSYVDSKEVLIHRKELKAVYHFDCMCARCVKELNAIKE